MSIAEGLIIGLHLLTAHTAGGYEAVTPGIYLRHESGITAGVLRNSLRRPGAYLGYTWSRDVGPVEVAVTVGGIAGYEAAKVMPLFVPSVKLGAVRLGYLPKPPKFGGSAGLHLSVEWVI
jgi:hypothetical protein